MLKNSKHPYAFKLLNDRLNKEVRSLKMWEDIIYNSTDQKSIEQANGNIPSTKFRINELTLVIANLNNIDHEENTPKEN